MESTSLRTFIGSIVCVDLVGYSKRTVAQQGAIKERLNRHLAKALQRVPVKDRIVLDTGDGATIGFLGDPELCLAFALRLRDVMKGAVRIGIHLGPVKLSAGMSGNTSLVGDGINIAERIAGIAQPGHIVVSRAFHDMVSRLSDRNTTLFHDAGVRPDRQGQEHEIFVVVRAQPSRDWASLRSPLALGIAGAFAVAVIAAGSWWALRKREPEPAPVLAQKEEPPAVPAPAPAPRVEAPPVREPARPAAPRSEPRESRPAESRSSGSITADGQRALSGLLGTARDAARSVGSTTSSVFSSVKDKTLSIAKSPPPPLLVSQASTAFPPEAASQGIRHGVVRARLDIDAAGHVTHVTILSADPPQLFDREAIRSLQRWRFNSGAEGRSYETELEFRR